MTYAEPVARGHAVAHPNVAFLGAVSRDRGRRLLRRFLAVDPMQKSIQNFEILNRLTKHGPVVATSHVGCANGLRPEKPSMIFAFTKSLRANRPAGFFVRESATVQTKNTVVVASLVRRQ